MRPIIARWAFAGLLLGFATAGYAGGHVKDAVDALLSVAKRSPGQGNRDFAVDLRLRNAGSETIEYNSYVMNVGSLVASVVDRNGKEIHPLPPPVPPENMDRFFKLLPPGAEAKFHYTLDGIIGVELKGTYWIRIEAEYRVPYKVTDGPVTKYTMRTATSNWVRFCASKSGVRAC